MQMAPYQRTTGDYVDIRPAADPTPKNVAFELLLDDRSKVRARIPMRVQIYPHDTTDSIVTTVKNFYGIYDNAASGVSFEDENGITLIARYENLRNNMTVYVRVIPIQAYPDTYADASYYAGDAAPTTKQHSSGGDYATQNTVYYRSPSRPSSRVARKRSASPSSSSRSHRGVSQHKQPPRNRSRGSNAGSFHGEYSDSDGTTYTSKKARGEHFASSDISMDNIVQDGRRKRPNFDSSVRPSSSPFFCFNLV